MASQHCYHLRHVLRQVLGQKEPSYEILEVECACIRYDMDPLITLYPAQEPLSETPSLAAGAMASATSALSELQMQSRRFWGQRGGISFELLYNITCDIFYIYTYIFIR